jgi:hypothetical protein
VEIVGKCCFKECGLQALTIEIGSRLRKLDEDVLTGCVLLRYLSLPASVEFLPDPSHFRELKTFEPTLVVFLGAGINSEKCGNAVFRSDGDDPSNDFGDGYDQCLIDLAHHC